MVKVRTMFRVRDRVWVRVRLELGLKLLVTGRNLLLTHSFPVMKKLFFLIIGLQCLPF